MPTLADLTTRVEVLERQETVYKMTLLNLERADSSTAAAVDRLVVLINDPKVGLIVELDRFRTEVKNDRRIVLAFIGGLVIIVNVVGPYIPGLVRTLLG